MLHVKQRKHFNGQRWMGKKFWIALEHSIKGANDEVHGFDIVLVDFVLIVHIGLAKQPSVNSSRQGIIFFE